MGVGCACFLFYIRNGRDMKSISGGVSFFGRGPKLVFTCAIVIVSL